jgi:hypothetical protein
MSPQVLDRSNDSPVTVLIAQDSEEATPHARRSGLREIDLHPPFGTTHVGPAAVAPGMKMQERLAAQIEGTAAPVIDTLPGSNFAQHVCEVAKSSRVNATHTDLLRRRRCDLVGRPERIHSPAA